ncbi:MAG: GNAT family N-acetyltransferase [Armatimonadota bacterium]
MSLIIRECEPADLHALQHLYEQLMDDGTSYDELCRGFETMQKCADCAVYVAADDGNVVGTFVLYLLPNMTHHGRMAAVLENIVVDSAYRRKGVGRAMLEYARELAVQNGCYKLSLTSNAARTGAHCFYEECGMIRHGISFRYVL